MSSANNNNNTTTAGNQPLSDEFLSSLNATTTSPGHVQLQAPDMSHLQPFEEVAMGGEVSALSRELTYHTAPAIMDAEDTRSPSPLMMQMPTPPYIALNSAIPDLWREPHDVDTDTTPSALSIKLTEAAAST